jgi:predicted O-linked N-acetylglucosamine transferase (SPINDLY family)
MRKISSTEIKKLEDLYKLNKLTELEKETKRFLQVENNNIILLNILGVVYLKKKFFKKAEPIFKKILNKNSNDKNALKNLGETYRKINKFTNAIKHYELYLSINPNDNEVINNLASCYLKNKRYEQAIYYYKDLTKKNPHDQEYLTNLGLALIESLNFKEGMQILEQLLDKNINNKRALSGYLFNQNYSPQINFDKINNYIKKFNDTSKKNNLNTINFCYKKKPEKINVGFVSPDFRSHPVGYAFTNVIEHLKSYNFKLFGYYSFSLVDELTNKFKKDFDYFHNVTDLNDEQIINKIRSDGIHILIDLAGYTSNNRLSIFLSNPAPIQISMLGYLATTGIKAIKYKIGDSHIYPENIEKNFSEKILRLPNIWSDFVVSQNIDISRLSFDKNYDEIIFGCFVTLKKINDNVIKLWSKVLKKFPNTKIYFKAPELNNVLVEKDLKKKFFNCGIKSDRLILEKSSDYKTYLESYSKVHISLDPFPWNGVTTSFESIWMGAPVFCLKGGDLPYSRCSYSINKNLKMSDWIANDENDYLSKLEKILSNKKELLLIKKNLRERAIKNNLFNSKEFTKNLADMLNTIWKNFAIE